MATITIPKRQYVVLRKVTDLSGPQFDELLKGLNELEASLSPLQFSKHLSEKSKTIPQDDIKSFVGLLCGLYPVKENNNKTASQIAADLKETAQDEKPLFFTPEKAAILEQRMTRLLSIDKAIAVTAKAHDVVTEHQHVFCAARIFSDIRPVFSASADVVSAAVVVHTLNIAYHEAGEHKEFYVAMDKTDIDSLKKVIERAEKKAKALHLIIKQSAVTNLDEGA